MQQKTTRLEVDGASLSVRHWVPEGPVRGVLQILHGMGEHCERYERFAEFLGKNGWATITHDHRGHGLTPTDARDRLFLSEEDGFDALVSDARAVSLHAREQHPELPQVVFGHSMGGYVAQKLMLVHDDYSGVTLCGISLNTGLLASAAHPLAKLERWRCGPRGVSRLLQRMSFGDFARKIPNRRTDFDWLSTDPAEVDKYIADPHCGEPATTGLWVAFSAIFPDLDKPANIARIRADLPIRIIAGGDDPVHDGGKGFRALIELYQGRGFEDLAHHLYPGLRHELLNEVGRDGIMQEQLDWMERVIV